MPKGRPAAVPLELVRLYAFDYKAAQVPKLFTPATGWYFALDGEGDRKSAYFEESLAALYGVYLAFKSIAKRLGANFKSGNLEILWESPPVDAPDFLAAPEADRRWTLLLRAPEDAPADWLAQAAALCAAKGRSPRTQTVRLLTLDQGPAVQMLHTGDPLGASATLAGLSHYAAHLGLELHGPLHVLFQNDPRRVPEKRLRSILRTGVRKIAESWPPDETR